MMRCKRLVSVVLVLAVMTCVFMITGCSGKDMSKEVVGTWYCWHWYYNTDGGDNGFFDENDYRVFKISEGEFTVESAEGAELKSGTYEWKKNGVADIYYSDGTFCSVETSFNDKGQLKLMITETKLIYVLEVD